MTITHDQKAAIGQTFLTEIARRIELRERTKKDLPPALTDAQIVAAIGADLEKKYPGTIAALGPIASKSSAYGPHITFKSGMTLHLENKIPLPTVTALDKAAGTINGKRGALCKELEFLHNLKVGNAVGAFQSYVARLWSPSSKGEVLPRSTFVIHFEAFADSKRGFTCEL